MVLADSFESGDFGAWSTVTAEGDARLTVEWPDAHGGNCAARIQISSSSTSRANVTRSLPPGTSEAWAAGWFRVDREGAANSHVGFFRIFDGSTRIADVYR